MSVNTNSLSPAVRLFLTKKNARFKIFWPQLLATAASTTQPFNVKYKAISKIKDHIYSFLMVTSKKIILCPNYQSFFINTH